MSYWSYYFMPIHIQIPTLKPTQICCCISPHTCTLQWDGCISGGQMMALFSLYQAAGCPYRVLWLHDAAGLILMILITWGPPLHILEAWLNLSSLIEISALSPGRCQTTVEGETSPTDTIGYSSPLWFYFWSRRSDSGPGDRWVEWSGRDGVECHALFSISLVSLLYRCRSRRSAFKM